MAISKAKKADIVGFLTTEISRTPGAVFVNFHGLSVAKVTALRKKLRAAGLLMSVVKKTLLRRVLGTSKIGGEVPELPGEVAVVYLDSGTDALSPAREVHTFAKPGEAFTPQLLGGIYEAQYVDAMFVKNLALIPPREQLYGQLASLLQSPIRALVIGLQAIANK